MWKQAGRGGARACLEARCDCAELLGQRGGGTVVLRHTVWPSHYSGLLHGFVRVNFVDGFGGVCAWMFCGGSLRSIGNVI